MRNPSEKRVRKAMDRLGVRIEDRQNYNGENSWRNGLYIYKKGELVAFISSIVHDKPSPFAINRKEHWFVYTNAKLDNRYVMGKINRRGFGARVVAPGSMN
jgi:hypothetical protein